MSNEEDETQIKFPEIAQQIMDMVKADQETRRKAIFDQAIDRANTARIKDIIAEIGWPTKSKVGEEASGSVWLLVQHADLDIAFQERCLEMMKSLPEGEINLINIAYLEDRVRVNKRLPQIYGTQFYTDENGNFGLRPIEDLEHVNERRKEMRLNTLEEYEKDMRESFNK